MFNWLIFFNDSLLNFPLSLFLRGHCQSHMQLLQASTHGIICIGDQSSSKACKEVFCWSICVSICWSFKYCVDFFPRCNPQSNCQDDHKAWISLQHGWARGLCWFHESSTAKIFHTRTNDREEQLREALRAPQENRDDQAWQSRLHCFDYWLVDLKRSNWIYGYYGTLHQQPMGIKKINHQLLAPLVTSHRSSHCRPHQPSLDWMQCTWQGGISHSQNASSNNLEITRLQRLITDWSQTPGQQAISVHFHIRCLAHVINLVVKDGLKQLSGPVEQLQDAVKYIHGSSARMEAFDWAMVAAHFDKKKKHPLKDVPTCWNSTFLMIESSVPLKLAFQQLDLDDEKFEACPSLLDWDKLAVMKGFLEPFYLGKLASFNSSASMFEDRGDDWHNLIMFHSNQGVKWYSVPYN